MSTPAAGPPQDPPEPADDAPPPPAEASNGLGAEATRQARAARAVRGALAAALCLEALTVLFVPRAIAPVDDAGLTGGRLAVLLTVAAALLVAAGLQRFRAGVVLGSVLQLAVLATGVLIGVMFLLGLLFAGVWVYLLRVRRHLTGHARSGPAG